MRIIKIIFFLSIILSFKIGYAQIDTIAVMPFQVIGDIKNEEIYGYGLPDAIANDLAQVKNIIVIERIQLSSVIRELELSQTGLINEKTAPKVGEMLGAKKLVLGTVQKVGNNVRVHARVITTAKGEVLFSVKADKKIKKFRHIFELEDIIAQKIIFRLGLKATKKKLDEIERIPTKSETAFNFYVVGIKYIDLGEYSKGLRNFKRAAELDKNFDWTQRIQLRAQQAFEELDKEVDKLNK